MPEAQIDMIITMMEKNPELFKKIAEEIQAASIGIASHGRGNQQTRINAWRPGLEQVAAQGAHVGGAAHAASAIIPHEGRARA